MGNLSERCNSERRWLISAALHRGFRKASHPGGIPTSKGGPQRVGPPIFRHDSVWTTSCESIVMIPAIEASTIECRTSGECGMSPPFVRSILVNARRQQTAWSIKSDFFEYQRFLRMNYSMIPSSLADLVYRLKEFCFLIRSSNVKSLAPRNPQSFERF